MLGKLIKYEFKATSGFMILMYSVLLAVSAVMSVGMRLNLDEMINEISAKFQLGGLILVLFSFAIICVFIIMNVAVISGMYFLSVVRFKSNLLGNQGYLMHTLPVKTRDNILAKNIVSVLWTILSFVAVVLAYFILFLGVSDTAVFKDLSEIVVLIAKNMEFDLEMAVVLFELALLVIVTLSNQYFQIYISMAVGYSSNTFQLAKSIGIYILISIVINIMQSFGYSLLVNLLAWWELSFFANTSITLGVNIVATVAITAVYYSITNYYLSNKLNLQ